MSSRARDAGQIVIFGESENDRKAIAALVEGLCPDAYVKALRRPLVLLKNVRPEAMPKQAERLAEAARAEAARRPIRCVFAHEDADAVEPKHNVIAERIEQALRDAGTPGKVHAVVPAWEIEAWWFLWPDLVGLCSRRWIEPRVGTRPGRITDAKEKLKRAVRPSGLTAKQRARFPDYRESDSIKIAETIRDTRSANRPDRGLSHSYDRFRDSVADCCSRPLREGS
jgi:hypothetical protein